MACCCPLQLWTCLCLHFWPLPGYRHRKRTWHISKLETVQEIAHLPLGILAHWTQTELFKTATLLSYKAVWRMSVSCSEKIMWELGGIMAIFPCHVYRPLKLCIFIRLLQHQSKLNKRDKDHFLPERGRNSAWGSQCWEGCNTNWMHCWIIVQTRETK